MFKIIFSVIHSMRDALQKDPEIQGFVGRHPILVRFVKNRLTSDEKFGLFLTIGSLCSACFIYFFFVIVKGLFSRDALIEVDITIINLVQLIRSQYIESWLWYVVILGSRSVVFGGVILLTIFFAFAKARRSLIVLMTTVGVSSLGALVLRTLFEKARPALATPIVQDTISLAGINQALIAFSCYGMVAYFFFRKTHSLIARAGIGIATLFFSISLALGSIYFELQWPSDILASLASCAALVTIMITVLEIYQKFNSRAPRTLAQSKLITTLRTLFLIFWVAFTLFLFINIKAPITQGAPEHITTVTRQDIPGVLFDSLPRQTETLFGTPTEPINVMLIGKEDQLLLLLSKAGWERLDPLSVSSLWNVLITILQRTPDHRTPSTPTFWNTRIDTFSFQKLTAIPSIRQRHHLHIWKTSLITENGDSIWLATTHFDKGIKFTSRIIVPTHEIDPAIDKERDGIKNDLAKTGLIQRFDSFQIVEPSLGKNTVGDTFFTDGKAYIFFLK